MTKIFGKVWYLPDENKWRDMNLIAFRDSGTLIVNDNSIEFKGKKGNVEIKNIKHISFGKQGRDAVNNWVKVDYGEDPVKLTAFFADGSGLGWGGIFGGTKKILSAIESIYQPQK